MLSFIRYHLQKLIILTQDLKEYKRKINIPNQVLWYNNSKTLKILNEAL